MSWLSLRTRTQLYCFASSPGRDLVGTVADAQALAHGMIAEPPPQPPLCLERRRLGVQHDLAVLHSTASAGKGRQSGRSGVLDHGGAARRQAVAAGRLLSAESRRHGYMIL